MFGITALAIFDSTNGTKPKAMKTLFHVYYHRANQDNEFCRQEYATSFLEAVDQAIEHFKMFGYGDEVVTYVYKP